MSASTTSQGFSEGIDAFKRDLFRSLGLTAEQQEIKSNNQQAELLRSRNLVSGLLEQSVDKSVPFQERLNRMQALSKVLEDGRQQAMQGTLAVSPQLLGIRGEKLNQDDSSYKTRLGAETESFNAKQGQQIEGISRLVGEQRQGELDYLQALGGVNSDFLNQVRAQTRDDREFYREMSKPKIADLLQNLVSAAAPLGVAKLMGVV